MVEKIVMLDIEKILPPDEKQRDMIDPERVRELAESMRSVGQEQAGLVRPSGDVYEIVYGHRRYLALRMLGEPKMKVVIRELTDEQVFELRAIENLQRVDLNPVEKAKVFQRWKDKFNMSNERIASRVGFTKTTIAKYLALLELPEEFQPAIAKKDLGIETAMILMEVVDPAMRSYYLRAAIDNGATGAVARMWVDDYKKTQSGQFYPNAGGDGGPVASSVAAPIYATCYCCGGPEEVQKIQYVPLCRECHKEVKGAVKLVEKS